MNIFEYVEQAKRFANYPDQIEYKFTYPCLGLSGEVAEVMSILFSHGIQNKINLVHELGDCLWYVIAICRDLNIDFGDVIHRVTKGVRVDTFDELDSHLRASISTYASMMTMPIHSGNLSQIAKKVVRDHGGTMPPKYSLKIISELGDMLIAIHHAGFGKMISLSEVAEANIKKLSSHKSRGTLHGGGDNR